MRNDVLALLLPTVLMLGACATAPNVAPVPLDVETGTWQMTGGITQGRKSLPRHVVDRLTPSQRREYEEDMRKSEILEKENKNKPLQGCVTAKDLEAGVFNSDIVRHGLKCKFVVKVGTATHQEVDRICEGSQGPYVAHVTVDADSRDSLRWKAVMPNPDIPIVVELTGKWMSAGCPE